MKALQHKRGIRTLAANITLPILAGLLSELSGLSVWLMWPMMLVLHNLLDRLNQSIQGDQKQVAAPYTAQMAGVILAYLLMAFLMVLGMGRGLNIQTKLQYALMDGTTWGLYAVSIAVALCIIQFQMERCLLSRGASMKSGSTSLSSVKVLSSEDTKSRDRREFVRLLLLNLAPLALCILYRLGVWALLLMPFVHLGIYSLNRKVSRTWQQTLLLGFLHIAVTFCLHEFYGDLYLSYVGRDIGSQRLLTYAGIIGVAWATVQMIVSLIQLHRKQQAS